MLPHMTTMHTVAHLGRTGGPGPRGFAAAVTFALTALLLAAMPAMAIVGGDPDGDRHPHVGMVYSPGFPNSCSGTLLSPTVVLTAGHCTHGFTRAGVPVYVSFAPEVDVDSAAGAIPAAGLHTHPDFCLGCAPGLPGFDAFDVGVVILAEPVTGLGFGQLPGAGIVDDLEKGTGLTAVGYGVRSFEHSGPPTPSDRGLRHRAGVKLIEVNSRTGDMFVKASGGSAKGGICFGDSGGPLFLSDETTVVAVAAFLANRVCEGVGYYQRVDQADVLVWLEGFLPASDPDLAG